MSLLGNLLSRVNDGMKHSFTRLSTGSIPKRLIIVLVLATIMAAIATFGALTSTSTPFGPDPETVIGLAIIDLTLLLLLVTLITRRLLLSWLAKRKSKSGSRLQNRVILMFSLVTIVPTVLVASFSVVFFNYGIQTWFDKRVSTALNESVMVAEAYLKEHKNLISSDVYAMAATINRQMMFTAPSTEQLRKILIELSRDRFLTDAVIFKGQKIIASNRISFSLPFERLPIEAIDKASTGQVVVLANDDDDLVRALIKLDTFTSPFQLDSEDTFLLVGRLVDNTVLDHLEKTKGAATEYQRLQANISQIQITFFVAFIIVSLLLLLIVIWLGLIVAYKLVRPIEQMVSATNQVKAGDLSARVPEPGSKDEISDLANAFNRMTQQLELQRSELVKANQEIDERRLFIETVLAGVSAGVIALTKMSNINLANRSALQLLQLEQHDIIGKPFHEVVPEMASMYHDLTLYPDQNIKRELTLAVATKKLSLLVRMAAEKHHDTITGFIVTFEDITELLSAQRSAAWSDIARRIAHEIKNPLTPIYLCAERLGKKFASESSDPETFTRYTETIIRHVSSLGEMVDEFANFARMPSPVMKEMSLDALVQREVMSRKLTAPHIHYHLHILSYPITMLGDEDQLSRALTNILKNAEEALESLTQDSTPTITVELQATDHLIRLTIDDNGKGFPEELLDRLTEPYVTTRSKGTGLGLAIVRKIVEDHNGQIALENTGHGAKVNLSFYKNTSQLPK